MNFYQLKAIYPEAYLADAPSAKSSYISFPYENQWIHFSKEARTETELELLALLFTKDTTKKQGQNSFWQAYLLDDTYASPVKKGIYRIVQYTIIKKSQDFDQELWMASFKDLFQGLEEMFFLNETSGLLVEKETDGFLSPEEMSGIIQTLDDDFSIRTISYIGQFWPLNAEFKAIFKEEQAIFHQQKDRGGTVFSLPDVALSHFTADAVAQSPIMYHLKKTLQAQPELKELIQAMWASQGNISLAAKSLYVHRNTLQYRIDRFFEISGLSLRNINTLLLCYLLTT